jgi:hypothetical protein
MRMENSSLSVALATPRGVACAVLSRNVRVGFGVAPGAKTLFGVFWGMLGEKAVDGGLPLMADARKMFRAVEMELLFKLLDGRSSRFPKSVRVDEL